MVSSTSSDEEIAETPDALMSLYLSPAPTNEGDAQSREQHQPEAPTDSMVAFKLTTPPREARLNFLNVTTSLE